MPRRKGKSKGAEPVNNHDDSQTSATKDAIEAHDDAPELDDRNVDPSDARSDELVVEEEDLLNGDQHIPEAGPSQPRRASSVAGSSHSVVGNTSNGNDEDEDGSDEDTDGDEEEDGEDDDEPTLRYSRLHSTAIKDIFARDSCSAVAVSAKYLVLGTHSGGVVVLARAGTVVKDKGKGKEVEKLHDVETAEEDEAVVIIRKYRPHSAMVAEITIDEDSQYIGTASMDGKVTILQVATSDAQQFNLGRPLRCLALEPSYASRSTRQFVSGGSAGSLILHEKGWLGPKDVTLHSGEGPIGTVRWRRNHIAWSNDRGVRIYDTHLSQRVAFIPRAEKSPRADLFPCSLYWQSDTTLLIAWADFIKVVKLRERRRPRPPTKEGDASDTASISSVNPLASMGNLMPGLGGGTHASTEDKRPTFEVVNVLQLDCMISSIMPFLPDDFYQRNASSAASSTKNGRRSQKETYQTTSQVLVLSYLSSETYQNEATLDRSEQKRKASPPPELRIISITSGEELSSDVLGITGYERYRCNDYHAVSYFPTDSVEGGGMATTSDCYFVVSPTDVVVVKRRDVMDHIAWLCERQRYEDALRAVEANRIKGILPSARNGRKPAFDVTEIGQNFLRHLFEQGNYEKAAQNLHKILGDDVKAWEDWIFAFVQKKHIDTVIPYVPTHDPRLSKIVYEMILGHYMRTDPNLLLQTIKTWPQDIYDFQAIVNAIRAEIDRDTTSQSALKLMECLIELHQTNRQPGKALQYYLRLRRPGVFDLIREHNLFPDVQDQVLLLIDFDQDMQRRQLIDKPSLPSSADAPDQSKHGQAIDLLVDHTQSIPIPRVTAQLRSNRRYLYMYLDALWSKDATSIVEYSDLMVDLLAEYEYPRLLDFLRSSTSYNLEKAYENCKTRDYVPEMVYLLGRMGNNKQALTLIIERLGHVQKAIDFAKEQNDQELWEDLLRYSENKPTFIRGLLENVGPEIDPIRLIRRIQNGLEIPGLKPALIKILQDFNIQISLIEGCKSILDTDCRRLTLSLYTGQSSAFFASKQSTLCFKCGKPAFAPPQPTTSTSASATSAEAVTIVFLCRHIYHISCALPDIDLPPRPQSFSNSILSGQKDTDRDRDISAKILFASQLKSRSSLPVKCPQCLAKAKAT